MTCLKAELALQIEPRNDPGAKKKTAFKLAVVDKGLN